MCCCHPICHASGCGRTLSTLSWLGEPETKLRMPETTNEVLRHIQFSHLPPTFQNVLHGTHLELCPLALSHNVQFQLQFFDCFHNNVFVFISFFLLIVFKQLMQSFFFINGVLNNVVLYGLLVGTSLLGAL